MWIRGRISCAQTRGRDERKGQAIANVTDIAEVSATGLSDFSAPKPRTKSVRKQKQPTPPGDDGLRAFAAAPGSAATRTFAGRHSSEAGGWGASR